MDTIKLRDKHVIASQPYRAQVTDFVGRESEIKMIMASWLQADGSFPLSPVLLGPPGVGKNRSVYECARLCGKDLYIFQGHEDVTAEDFACAVRFSDDPGRKVDYILSGLVTAMVQGGICLVDEIGKVRPRALAPLVSVLDERRYIDSTLLGERIFAHPGFRFIAATNSGDFEAGTLPDFIRSRLRPVIEIGYPSRDEIREIVRTRLPRLGEGAERLLHSFWRLWRDQNGDRMPAPRDVVYVFGLALNLADFEEARAKNGQSLSTTASGKVMDKHLELSFQQLQHA